MAKIINLTRHPIRVFVRGKVVTFYPSGIVARAIFKTYHLDPINDIPIIHTEVLYIDGLPKEKKGFYYIVSNIVHLNSPNRRDLLIPDRMIKNNFEPLGCRGFRK